jgi:hypothetical protein
MRTPCVTGIKASVLLAVVLGLAAVNRMDETITAAAQANSSQQPALQEEKPFDQKQALADLRKKLVGQENKPSEEVFKNIQIPLFKKLPAQLLLGAMEFVFSKSLGVDCRHCHVVEQWEKDEKPAKQIARDMYGLMLSIQSDLKRVRNLKSANPVVSCYTCHRGQAKPEVELPELKKKQ